MKSILFDAQDVVSGDVSKRLKELANCTWVVNEAILRWEWTLTGIIENKRNS